MSSVLIVGAGEFGASTAVALLRSKRYSSVTIIDRAASLPAEDAASSDINKVVRFDYSDPVYSRLAREAIRRWNESEWKGIYHESGVVVLGTQGDSPDSAFARAALANVQSQTDNITVLETPEAITQYLSPPGRADVYVAEQPRELQGYHNPVGGWAAARDAVVTLLEQATQLGANVVPSASLAELLLTDDGKDVRGVRTEDGRQFLADKVIIATGSWTPTIPALQGLAPEGLMTATGQVIAAIQLDEEMRRKYENIPVVMRFDEGQAGFYSFPPTVEGMLKFAFHGAGFLSETGVPRTGLSPEAVKESEEKGLAWIPKTSLVALRRALSLSYPELAALPVAMTRMCWYSDVADGNWCIDYHPRYPSLLYASGGAGHAFKFLPIIGELIQSRLEDTMENDLKAKWSLSRSVNYVDPARAEMGRKPLIIADLATKEDMARTPGDGQ